MAVQKGIHLFIGKLGPTNGFKLKGQTPHYERTNGGASADTIATAPEFIRTRENMAEFGGSAKASKRIRDSIAILPTIADSVVSGRCTGVCNRILHQDLVSTRGQRNIDFNSNPTFLAGFEFNKFNSLTSIASMPFLFTFTGATQAALTVPDFSPTAFLDIPPGATDFTFFINAFILSNYIFDVNNPPNYVPEDATNNGEQANSISSFFPIGTNTGNNVFTATVTNTYNSPQQSLVGTWGILFWQKIGANYFRFAQNDAGRIEALRTI